MTLEDLIDEIREAAQIKSGEQLTIGQIHSVLLALAEIAIAYPDSRTPTPSRLNIQMPVASLGYLIRLQSDSGLYKDYSKSEVIRFHVRHFRTPRTTEGMSYNSLKNAMDLPVPHAIEQIEKWLWGLYQKAKKWEV